MFVVAHRAVTDGDRKMRLRRLYWRPLDHRVEAVQHGTQTEEDLKPSEAAHIGRIAIIEPEEQS